MSDESGAWSTAHCWTRSATTLSAQQDALSRVPTAAALDLHRAATAQCHIRTASGKEQVCTVITSQGGRFSPSSIEHLWVTWRLCAASACHWCLIKSVSPNSNIYGQSRIHTERLDRRDLDIHLSSLGSRQNYNEAGFTPSPLPTGTSHPQHLTRPNILLAQID